MIDLTPYLNILGLPPNATWDQVEQRYRTLVIFWHPDRVSSPHHKALAEEELKKINNAKDKLKQHWRDWQNRPRSSTSQSDGSSSEPGNAHTETKRQKEQERKRAADEARRKREAENRRREEKRRQQQADFDTAYQHYFNSQKDRQEENSKHHRLGQRFCKIALLASASLLTLGFASNILTDSWASNLKTEYKNWTKREVEQRMQSSALKGRINPCENRLSPFSAPMPPP